MTDTTPNIEPCDKVFNDYGAHTVTIIDGVICCPSCKQPIKEHK